MHYFSEDVIIPFIREKAYRRLCEIGAQHGAHTDLLLAGGAERITVVDPCLGTDLVAKYEGDPRVTVARGRSLEVLPALEGPFDCFLIDGDHNWYTVYNELSTIADRSLLRRGGVILLHDIRWPYARRDLYYEPEAIPAACRHPWARQGIVAGRSELSRSDGINAWLCNACHEGGPRNGVLTAIEDFIASRSRPWHFFSIDQEFGLGFLFREPPSR